MNNILDKWHPLERMWLLVALMIVLLCSMQIGDSWQSLLTAVAGISYVIFNAKGSLWGYFFGIIYSLFYAYCAYQQTLYGEALLTGCYYFPMMIIGFFVWKNNWSYRTNEVIRANLDWWGKFIISLGVILITCAFGDILAKAGDAHPYCDAFTTVASVYALYLMVKRCTEQWYLWVIINAVSIYMWCMRYTSTGDNIAILGMWIIYFINSIYGWFKWARR